MAYAKCFCYHGANYVHLRRPKFASGILAFAVGQLGMNEYHLTHEKQMEVVFSVTFVFMLLYCVPPAQRTPS